MPIRVASRCFLNLLFGVVVSTMVWANVPPGRIKVFILAGQSNMEGQAVVDLTGHDYNNGKGTLAALLQDPKVGPNLEHLKDAQGNWKIRDDVWITYQRENARHLAGHLGLGYSVYGDQHHFGVELQFGHVVGDYFAESVLLIKTAWGGKSLYEDFRPPSSGGKTGKYYALMIEQVKTALANVGRQFPELDGRGYDLAGFVWWQGWNDGTDPKHAVPEYERNLVNLIHDIRRDLKAPKLPVVIGELTGPWVQAPGEWNQLRQAQEAATRRPEFAGNVLFIPTHDFVRKPENSPNPTHGHHEFGNAETYFLVGDALGRGAISLLGKPGPVALKDYGKKSYSRLSVPLPHVETKTWKLTAALPYNCQFQPSVVVDASSGQQIQLNSTNPLVLYLTPTETVTTLSGTHEYEAQNWVSGEGASYTIPAGVTVKAARYRETGYDTTFAGSFQSDNSDFNILWKRAARTAYLCMRDHFYDCPDRERVGFWGDGTPELDQCFYIFDRNTDRICRDLVLRKLEPNFYPGQHLEFLGEYGLWTYYLHTGDISSIRAVYEPTKTFLLHTYVFGHKDTWFDWGNDSKDTSIIETCFYYIDLVTLRKMALATGHPEDVPLIASKLQAVRDTFNTRFWKGSYYQSQDVTQPDDRANAMAVNAGLAEPSKWSAIYNNVLSKTTNASCFFDRWVFEALCKMNLQDKALLRMSTRYRTMIDSEITSLWEHYDRWWASWLNAFDDASSLNHGWNPPALVLSQDIAGIRPTEPAWSAFEVRPREAFLNDLDVTVPSMKGDVKLKLHKTTTQYSLEIASPKNTSALVAIPTFSFTKLNRITCNGQTIWSHGCANSNGITGFNGLHDGYLEFKVQPGTWHFVANGQLPVTTPKPRARISKRAQLLDSRTWTATSSNPDSTFLFSGAKIPIDIAAANAIDGDLWTGWRDMTNTQHPGQWFQVDMKQTRAFDEIVLDNTWALWDSPQTYSVTISEDGVNWSQPIATGQGHLGITHIPVTRQHSRFIRVTQTGTNATYHWSIYEFKVLKHGQ